MHFYKSTFTLCVLLVSITLPAVTQQNQEPNKPIVRIGMPPPQNLSDMKDHSIDLWIKSRQNTLPPYRYINEAAEFRAYLFTCKRHDLNLQMGTVAKLVNKYIQAVIPAQYDEPELKLVLGLSKEEQQAFFGDMADEIYAFEFGMHVALQNIKIKESAKTNKSFCATIQNEYFQTYVALLATAKRETSQ